MDQTERQVIDDLFGKLRTAHEQSGPRDAEAERLIGAHVGAQPAIPYYMAQAILVQEHALKAAQARVEQLEGEIQRKPAGGGSFLSGLFGGGGDQAAGAPGAAGRLPPQPPVQGGPFQGRTPGGSGFLGGALQTAMGVAGGLLIGNMLMSAFADPAAAAEGFVEDTAQEYLPQDQSADPGADDPGYDDGGGWDEEL